MTKICEDNRKPFVVVIVIVIIHIIIIIINAPIMHML